MSASDGNANNRRTSIAGNALQMIVDTIPARGTQTRKPIIQATSDVPKSFWKIVPKKLVKQRNRKI